MKIGIVGNGSIVQTALEHLKIANIQVTALWCRNEEKGKPLCTQYNLKQYTLYEQFLADDSYDTVYIGLVNSLHYEYTLKAIEAHKHVIVEKPFTSRYGETIDLIAAAQENEVMLFEAMMSRYSKNYAAIIPHLDEIGDLKLIRSNFSQYSRRYSAYLDGKVLPAFDPNLSGGALYDINVYNMSFTVGIFGSPRSVQYFANKGFNGIDTSGTAVMEYDGFKAICTGAKDSDSPCFTVLQGTKGYIEIPCKTGFVKNVTLHLNGSSETKILDVADESNPMAEEFLAIQKVIDEEDWNQEATWLIRTKQVMAVLDQARVSASIHFTADDDAAFTIE